MNEDSQKNTSALREFAEWLRKKAADGAFDLKDIQPYAGFWAKVSSGRIKTLPSEVVSALEKHFRKSIADLANDAGVTSLANTSDTLDINYAVSLELPILPPEHEISLVWSDGVPDHMWPFIAEQRGYFADARIRATILDAECASDFPDGYGTAMKSCLPQNACGVGTWNEMEGLCGWPIALTHHFIGFAAVGRAPSRIKPLTRDSGYDLGHLVYEISKRHIRENRIGCVTDNSIEFLKLAIDLGRECLSDASLKNIPIDEVKVAVERTPNMLEELYELGELGWDLVVGHALTHGIALQNSNRYQVYFTWERILAIAEKMNSSLCGPLKRLAVPAPFMLNREPQPSDRALICRLWSVAFRAAKSIIGEMPPSDAAQLLSQLKSLLPYSNPNDISITPNVFSNVWKKSYRPLTAEEMLQPLDYPRPPLSRHDSLAFCLSLVNEEKEKAESALAQLAIKESPEAKQALPIARQYVEWGNFFDANITASRFLLE